MIQLARRLFYSFAKPGADVLYVKDIAAHFTSMEHAEKVFTLFDKDSNGDVSRDEIEMALLYVRRLCTRKEGDSGGVAGNFIENSSPLNTPCKTWTVRWGDWTIS